jgi:uncharacterized protein YgbK (DUF1537 family)
LRWDRATLRRGLAHPSPFLFLLANTRALDPAVAAERLRQICRQLRPALAEAQAAGELDQWLLVSRGDSTLRGHFPLEVELLAEELGPFDATLLVPAFLPGGRTTRHGVHLLQGEPVHTTPFARDRLFGYQSSYLPDWVAEKSGGRIPAASVQRLTLAELDRAAAALASGAGGSPGDRDRQHASQQHGSQQHGSQQDGFQQLCARLAGLEGNGCVAVDAERPQQLAALGAAVRELTAPAAAGRWGRPRRFLFQSAASLLNGLVEIGPPPLDPAGLAGLRRRDGAGRPLPGLVLVGSHVPLADAQLEQLLNQSGCSGLELPVAKLARVLEGPAPQELLASLERQWGEQLEGLLAEGRTPVLFTSRGELHCRHAAERRRLGLALAGLMARLAARLAPRLGYLVSKGGITSHTLLADGLDLALVELQGQLLPGLSLVLTPAEAAVPRLPVVTFPGNLGQADSLVAAWRLLEGPVAASG